MKNKLSKQLATLLTLSLKPHPSISVSLMTFPRTQMVDVLINKQS